MLSKADEYLQAARRIANARDSATVWELWKMVRCRLRWGFGPFYYYLYRFADKPADAPGEYMKKRELEVLQRSLNGDEGVEMVSDKVAYHRICLERGLPAPPLLAVYQAGDGPDPDPFERLRDGPALRAAFEAWGPGTYIFKPSSGAYGAAIVVVEFDGRSWTTPTGDRLDGEALTKLPRQEPYLIQRYVTPHPALGDIMPGPGLGTFRIMTLNCGGRVEFMPACAKLPTGNNRVDNFAKGTNRNLVAAIDVQDGRLIATFRPHPTGGGLLAPLSHHPDTGATLTDYRIPHWPEILAVAEEGSRAFEGAPAIGWDVALTTDGPLLIEANGLFDCDILQMTHDRGMKRELTHQLGGAGRSIPDPRESAP